MRHDGILIRVTGEMMHSLQISRMIGLLRICEKVCVSFSHMHTRMHTHTQEYIALEKSP